MDDYRVDYIIPGYVAELAATMQKDDIKAILALSGQSPMQGLQSSIENSFQSECWLVNGRVAAISGISKLTHLSEWACPWLLCSDLIRDHPRYFLRQTKYWFDKQLQEHGKLMNVTHAEHKRSVRWLEWLGVHLYPAQPFGVKGELFH